MNFFKKVFASCLGTLLFFVLIGIVFVVIGLFADNKPKVVKNSILHIKLNGEIKEKVERSNKLEIVYTNKITTDLAKIVKSIKAAKTDEKIQGIYLEPVVPIMGYTSADILRKAIQDFKTSGKFVYSYSDYYTPLTYYIASVSDSVFMNPGGMIHMTGFASEAPYLKEFFDNVGVKWNIFYAGQFKSATEPLRLNKMSDQNRLQLHEFLGGLYKHTSDTIVASRGMEKDSLESFVNNFKGLFSRKTVEYGLVDSLIYNIDYIDFLRGKTKVKKSKKLKLVSVSKYSKTIKAEEKKDRKNQIAVIYMEGSIVNSGKEPGQISPEKFAKAFDDILRKDKIKGVVVRVNSPGGSGSASDEILRALDKIKEAGKPVIISMGDYAASGGYFISCHADTIVASPNTLTGSIGVFAMIPEFKELMDDKLKIHFDTVKTHNMGTAFSATMGMEDSAKKLLQEYIDGFYEDFLNIVGKGRNMTRDQVHEVAQGRIWLGDKAKDLGLVDVLGDLDDAIAICVDKAKLSSYSLTKYPRTKSNFFTELMDEIANQNNVESKILNSRMLREFKPIIEVMNDKSMIATPIARMPYNFDFNK